MYIPWSGNSKLQKSIAGRSTSPKHYIVINENIKLENKSNTKMGIKISTNLKLSYEYN